MNVFIMDPGPRFGDAPRAAPPEDDEPELSPREKYKKKLARAWLYPAAPRYWDPPPIDPIAQATVPAAINPAKGSGPVSAEEIAEFKANEREEFKRQLTERWRNNLMHL